MAVEVGVGVGVGVGVAVEVGVGAGVGVDVEVGVGVGVDVGELLTFTLIELESTNRPFEAKPFAEIVCAPLGKASEFQENT